MRSIGKELDLLLARMSMVSEGETQKWDAVRGGEESSEPPGAWRDETSFADDWYGFLGRVADVMRIEMDRWQGQTPRTPVDKEDREVRIIHLHEGRTVGFVCFVEGIPESEVVKIRRRHNRNVKDGTHSRET